ncbi:MAG: flagellar filament capping protein FliD [Clostridia bacterium]
MTQVGSYGRITGLASGMDTESMVKQMIDAESYRLNKYKQNQQWTDWKQEKYRNVNLDFANFIVNSKKDMELSKNLSSGSSFNSSIDSVSWTKKVTSSNTAAVTATSTGTAVPGTYSVTVSQLAKGVQAASAANLGDITATSKLSNLGVTGSIDDLYINGKKIEKINSDGTKTSLDGDSTIKDLVNAINRSGAGVTASFDEGTGRFFVASNVTGAENAEFQVTGGVTAAGEPDSSVVIGTQATALMNALDLNVTYTTYDVDGNASSMTEALDLTKAANGTYVGQDAKYSFAGAEGLTSSTNQVSINGVNMVFNTEGTTTVAVETDIDGIIEKVKKLFETDYNGLIDKLTSQLNEKTYRDYQPLLDEERDEMTDEQIEKWETMAKSGTIRNDMLISSTLSSLRSTLYEEVEGDGIDSDYDALYKVGIKTKSYFDGGKSGQVEVDETKLREALQDNPQAVVNLLFKDYSGSYTSSTISKEDKEETKKQMGIVGRIYNEMTLGVKNIISKAGYGDEEDTLRNVNVGGSIFIDYVTSGGISLLDKELNNLADQIDLEQERLNDKEDRYYSQFTAMETALSRMNSQAGWLAQQFGG